MSCVLWTMSSYANEMCPSADVLNQVRCLHHLTLYIRRAMKRDGGEEAAVKLSHRVSVQG